MRTPPFLQHGHKVAVTAPASRVNTEDITAGRVLLQDWGLEVVTGATVGRHHHNFSDTFVNRRDELQGFLDDPEIKCIFAARGGYGVSDLVDHLDFTRFSVQPKWIVGFSDLTALLLHTNALGFEAVHGPMVKTLAGDGLSAGMLKALLFGSTPGYPLNGTVPARPGKGTGPAVGGNLVLLAHSIGSASDISYDGRVLFIEDIGEKIYNIDRLMVQLKRAGKLERLAGLVGGQFTDMAEPTFGATVEEIILHHTEGYRYPVALGFPFGHEKVNFPLVMGRPYTLEVMPEGVSLSIAAYV